MAAGRDGKFIVEFEDGTRDYFFIEATTLRTGDHVHKGCCSVHDRVTVRC
jgi:hypothetical protein